MFSKLTVMSSLSLLAALATAAPSASSSSDPVCDGRYLVEKWGRVVAQPSWNSSRFGVFMGCEDKAMGLSKREDFDTTVESTDDSAQAIWVDGTAKPYDTLWDEAVDMLCGETFCDGEKSVSVASGLDEETLVLSLDGNFADSALRDDFISLIKDAFYKSILTTDVSPIHEDRFIAFAHATTSFGDASGFELTMRMTDVASDTGCPEFISQIASFGALVPELSTVFGVAGAVCGAV